MQRIDLLKKSVVTSGVIKVGSIDIAGNMALELKAGVPYMLAPQIDPRTGVLTSINLEQLQKKPEDLDEFELFMEKMAKEIEEDAWIVLQYRIGSISAEEAHAQRDELHKKRQDKIRDQKVEEAKAAFIKLMESL